MSDYGRLFREDVAHGLGLTPRPLDPEEAVRVYRESPATAFTRAATFLQPPGGAVPVPFASRITLTDELIPSSPSHPSGKE